MEPLNMCMFATRVDYDAAVRKRHEALEQQNVVKLQQGSMSKPESLTKINKSSIIPTS